MFLGRGLGVGSCEGMKYGPEVDWQWKMCGYVSNMPLPVRGAIQILITSAVFAYLIGRLPHQKRCLRYR
jgi:hypothetical protein